MGLADTVTKVYMKENTVFADAFTIMMEAFLRHLFLRIRIFYTDI